MNCKKPKGLFLLSFVLTVYINLVPAQEATVKIDADAKLATLLELRKELGNTDFYTIQIYQSKDPNKAKAAYSTFRNTLGYYTAELKFNTPNYKVWVGEFQDRLEAERALLKIKTKYEAAFILKPKKEK